MEHKKILLTGGHSGIGLELTKTLIQEGHKIGLIVRNEKRKNEVINEFDDSNKIDFFFADLSKREQIQSVCETITSKWKNIDIIFNNAGVLLDKLYYSDYGNELQLEINAISPYLFTKELLSLLGNSENLLIVNTATAGLHKKKLINIQELKKPKTFTKLTGSYLDSKLMMILLMNHLNTKNDHIRIINVNPGAIKTKMTSGNGMPLWLKPIRNLFFKSPKEGAKALYEAAFNSKNKGNGIYLVDGKVKVIQISLSDKQVDEVLSISK